MYRYGRGRVFSIDHARCQINQMKFLWSQQCIFDSQYKYYKEFLLNQDKTKSIYFLRFMKRWGLIYLEVLGDSHAWNRHSPPIPCLIYSGLAEAHDFSLFLSGTPCHLWFLCWASYGVEQGFFLYRLSIVLFFFFFINCNFISNPITDKARIGTGYNCSILYLWDEKPIFSLWSHLISKYNAHFYDFAEGGKKSRCILCDKDYNIRLGTPMFHSYVEKLYSFPKHKQWLGHFHHTTRYLDGEITICYVWGGRLPLRVWLDKTNFIHFLFVNDIRCLG